MAMPAFASEKHHTHCSILGHVWSSAQEGTNDPCRRNRWLRCGRACIFDLLHEDHDSAANCRYLQQLRFHSVRLSWRVYPVLILHVILLPLNSLRLREMLRLTKQVREAAQSDLKMDWLKPFTSSRRVSVGDILFRKDDTANAMYFIVSGRHRLTELGIDVLPGQVVGELALLAPDPSRTQTLECIESGEVLQITYEQFKQLYYQNPQFGFYFLQLTTRRLFRILLGLRAIWPRARLHLRQPRSDNCCSAKTTLRAQAVGKGSV